MLAALTSTSTTLTPDMTSVSVKSEAATIQKNQAVQADKPPATASYQQSSHDSVALSDAAIGMSKAMHIQSDQKQETEQKVQVQGLEKQENSYLSAGKAYPPFMGNAEELKSLKESSPALYREILRMIVPPPLDISYSDMQMLQSVKGQSGSS